MKAIRTELGTGRLIYNLTPDQFRDRTARALRSHLYDQLILDGDWIQEIPAPPARSPEERVFAARATLNIKRGCISKVEVVARVNALTARNFRQPISEGVLLRPEEDDEVMRYTYLKVLKPGYETRDELIEMMANYVLSLVSGETTVKSVVAPMAPEYTDEETAAVQIGINDGVVGVSVDIAARGR